MNNSGDLNRRVEIWGKEPVLDSAGNPEKDKLSQEVIEPQKLATVWASVSPRTGSLLSGRQADTILSKTTHLIKIRYSAFKTLSDKNWLIYQGHRFNIDYILNPGFSNEFLEIFCNEVV